MADLFLFDKLKTWLCVARPLKLIRLVVISYFAVMDGGDGIGISHVPLLHHGVDHPVIGTFQVLFDATAEVGQGIS